MRIDNFQHIDYFLGKPVLQPSPMRWDNPLEAAKLKSSELHLWQANLDADDWSPESLYQSLSGDEKQRVKDFHLEHLQRRYITSRGLLRTILSHYLHVSANEIIFSYGPNGKPSTRRVTPQLQIEFNLSHSNEMFLLGINQYFFLGVDIEAIKPPLNFIELARRVFNKQIYHELISQPTEKQYDYFFRQWTLKEAHLKAQGLGLNNLHTPDNEVALEPVQPSIDVDWLNFNFIPKPGYTASVIMKLSQPAPDANFILRTFTATNDFLQVQDQ